MKYAKSKLVPGIEGKVVKEVTEIRDHVVILCEGKEMLCHKDMLDFFEVEEA